MLKAPFPWFGGKSKAAEEVWSAFGSVRNYVEPFAGSAAMLLAAPDEPRIETINDLDGMAANFWRAIAHDPEAVADAADWPCNENDLFARHSWLVRQKQGLTDRLHSDPDYFDPKIAGWWCWGACNWIGAGWCSGKGPWIHDGEKIIDSRLLDDPEKVNGVSRQLPHLGNAGKGINRKLPHLGNAGKGINRKLPHLGDAGKGINRQTEGARRDFIFSWFGALHERLRDVRVACGDWSRVLGHSVTTKHGLTAVFLDPPYTNGDMDYAAGGTGGALASEVRDWCRAHGGNPLLRIVLCGHAGEHDALISHGWTTRTWKAGAGYAKTAEAHANHNSETLWCSPFCVPRQSTQTHEQQAALI